MNAFRRKCTVYAPYVIPSIMTLIYAIIIIILFINGIKCDWYDSTAGFVELCKSLVGFTTIILGIYGVVVPIALGKMNDAFSKTFWELIDKRRFVADVKRIIISGIMNILFCSMLLIYDILPFALVNIIICIVIWTLIFFMLSSYRFISIFMNLIAPNDERISENEDSLSEEERAKLKGIKKL